MPGPAIGLQRHASIWGVSVPAGIGILILFCLYLAIYHGVFGLLFSLIAGKGPIKSESAAAFTRALGCCRTGAAQRITGFPWGLLGTTQVDNIPLSRIASVTGVYGLSFEIMLVNAACAAAFLVQREKRELLLIATVVAAVNLAGGKIGFCPRDSG